MNAGSQVAYTYYGATEGPISNTCGVSAGVGQGGLLKQVVEADPDGAGPGTPIVREFVYDVMGRQVAGSSDLRGEVARGCIRSFGTGTGNGSLSAPDFCRGSQHARLASIRCQSPM